MPADVLSRDYGGMAINSGQKRPSVLQRRLLCSGKFGGYNQM
jgi:hypothetical protein